MHTLPKSDYNGKLTIQWWQQPITVCTFRSLCVILTLDELYFHVTCVILFTVNTVNTVYIVFILSKEKLKLLRPQKKNVQNNTESWINCINVSLLIDHICWRLSFHFQCEFGCELVENRPEKLCKKPTAQFVRKFTCPGNYSCNCWPRIFNSAVD